MNFIVAGRIKPVNQSFTLQPWRATIQSYISNRALSTCPNNHANSKSKKA